MFRKLTALAVGTSALLAASSASAQSASQAKAQAFVDESGWSVAGLLGFGFSNYVGGFGLGVRGGYTLPSHVYLGGTFVDFPVSFGNTFFTGFEGGYDIKAGPLAVRPYGGVGLIDISYNYPAIVPVVVDGVATSTASSVTASATFFSLWVGGTVMYPITEQWFVGGDFRFLIVPSVNSYEGSGFTAALLATGGYQF
jgi:hypothetical protein